MRFFIILLCLAAPATASANTPNKAEQLNRAVEGSAIPEIKEAPTNEKNEMLCLALNLYHEARGSTTADQQAVGMVTLNRAQRGTWGGSGICNVVWKQSQFSWTLRRTGLVPREKQAWQKVQEIAKQVYKKEIPDMTKGATHYYAPRAANPRWARAGYQKRKIGSHIYMKLATN